MWKYDFGLVRFVTGESEGVMELRSQVYMGR